MSKPTDIIPENLSKEDADRAAKAFENDGKTRQERRANKRKDNKIITAHARVLHRQQVRKERNLSKLPEQLVKQPYPDWKRGSGVKISRATWFREREKALARAAAAREAEEAETNIKGEDQ